ncbi:MAG: gamma-glutamylcyclotransferase [Sphingomonadaceae bacterium]
MAIDNFLATYGTLAPGQPNHHQLASLSGVWMTGTVKGWLVDKGWGSALGYPALVPDEAGGPIGVHVLNSPDLPAHWSRLDAFEGTQYRRVAIRVETAESTVDAWIYIEAQSASS